MLFHRPRFPDIIVLPSQVLSRKKTELGISDPSRWRSNAQAAPGEVFALPTAFVLPAFVVMTVRVRHRWWLGHPENEPMQHGCSSTRWTHKK